MYIVIYVLLFIVLFALLPRVCWTRVLLEDTSSFRFGYICRAWLMGAVSSEVHGEEPSWNQQMKELPSCCTVRLVLWADMSGVRFGDVVSCVS